MSRLFGRQWSLTVSNGSETIEFNPLRIKFRSTQSDVETPNSLYVRIYNLSSNTANLLQLPDFKQVTLQAGYEGGPYGPIFSGTVIQYRKGRESQVDTYCDILATDGDEALNFGTINYTLAKGSTPSQQWAQIVKASGLKQGYLPDFTGLPAGNGQLPRGKVLYGLWREEARDFANTLGARASVKNGALDLIPLTSYIDTEATVLNSMTGLIGIPEQTADGIKGRCLLNPTLQIGAPVQINNADIQGQQFDVAYAAINQFPSISTDGLYRILIAEWFGDTRGSDWDTEFTCLSIDPTANAQNAVNAYPGSTANG